MLCRLGARQPGRCSEREPQCTRDHQMMALRGCCLKTSSLQASLRRICSCRELQKLN